MRSFPPRVFEAGPRVSGVFRSPIVEDPYVEFS